MKFHALLAMAVLSLPSLASAQILPVNRESVWFKPSLTADSAPVCTDVLRAVQDMFFSEQGYSDYGSLTPIQRDPESTNPHGEIVGTDFTRQWQLTRPDGQRVFARSVRFLGCCDTERVRVSDKFIENAPSLHDESLPGTPRAPGWNISEGPDGEFYALGVVDGESLAVYRLAGPSDVGLACEVELKPKKFSDHPDATIRQAWRGLEELSRAFGSVSQGAGYCGTLRAHDRGYERLERALQETLYRPWLTLDELRSPRSLETLGVDDQLRVWALGGIGEYRA